MEFKIVRTGLHAMRNNLLFIEFEPVEKKVLNIFLPSEYQIEYVTDQPVDGKLKVALWRSPSLYFF